MKAFHCSTLFYTHFGIHRTLEMSAYSFLRINIMKEIVKQALVLSVTRRLFKKTKKQTKLQTPKFLFFKWKPW